jgi:hypothetical protein
MDISQFIHSFLALACEGEDIVFRFIIEYIVASIRDFFGRPLGNNNRSILFYMRIVERWFFWACVVET